MPRPNRAHVEVMVEDSESTEDSSTPMDNIECLFQVEYLPQAAAQGKSKKRLTEAEARYAVRPESLWESMKRYRNFVVDGENLGIHDFVYVNSPGEDSEDREDGNGLWIARVLEVRAHDPTTVYLRIFWLYHPNDLPDGKEEYHGTQEMVASNDMAIIDARTVAGGVDVSHWNEEDEDNPLDGLYWRQTWNVHTEELSQLKQHCICSAPQNPDHPLLACSNASCTTRLHPSCIIESALVDLRQRFTFKKPPTSKKKAKKPTQSNFNIEIHRSEDDTAAPKLMVTDLNGGEGETAEVWEQEIKCLACQIVIR